MISKFYLIFEVVERCVNYFIYYITVKLPEKSLSNRILLTKLDHIGDFILFSSSLKAYRQIFPKEHITLLVQDCTFNAAELCPYVDEIWKINQRDFRRNLLSRIRWAFKMRDGHFDIAINSVYSLSANFFDCLVGFTHAKKRIGFASDDLKSKRGKPFYTELVPETQNVLFEIDKNFSLLKHLGYKGEIDRSPVIWLDSKDAECAQSLLSELGGEAYGILFPGSRQVAKIWPLKNYCGVLMEFQTVRPIHWIICGGRAEIGLCSSLVEQLQKNGISSFNFAGKTSVRELAAIVKGASIYVGNDTMAAHLAAAFKVPSVCVLGGGHFGRFYPYPGNLLTQAVTNKLPCFNCNWQCSRDVVACVSDVTIEQVASVLTYHHKQGFV